MKSSITPSKVISFLGGLFVFFLFYVLLSTIKNDTFIYPTIGQIFTSFFSFFKDGALLKAMAFSLLRVLLVVFISFGLSIILTILYIYVKNTKYFIQPMVSFFKATPLAIISVYLWISLGSEKAPYLISFLMIFPVMIESFFTSIDEISNEYLLEMKTENVPKIKKIFRVYLPLIRPYIFMSLLQTFGLGLKAMLMGEYLCQSKNSLGEQIYHYKQALSFDKLLALLIFIVILVLLCEVCIRYMSLKLEKK